MSSEKSNHGMQKTLEIWLELEGNGHLGKAVFTPLNDTLKVLNLKCSLGVILKAPKVFSMETPLGVLFKVPLVCIVKFLLDALGTPEWGLVISLAPREQQFSREAHKEFHNQLTYCLCSLTLISLSPINIY